MYVTAIVLAAGKGSRLGLKVSKPLVEINSQPIIVYCLKIFSRHPYVKDIIVVINSKNSKSIINKIKQYRISKIRHIVKGGLRRQDSVLCGLRAIDSRSDLVLIHDSARPFLSHRLVSSVIAEAKRSKAAIAGVPVKATIKKVTKSVRKPPRRGQSHPSTWFGCAHHKSLRAGKVTSKFEVKETLNREDLWEVQTPQVFSKDLILKAYKKYASNIQVTDDAMLVEKLGVRVSIVRGSYNNIKITTPEDLLIAQAIAKLKVQNSR